jgi:flagellar motor switch protein FliG
VAEQLDNRPIKAFKARPSERVGAILTSAPAALRDSLMKGLQEEDAQFAETVEKWILPFEHIRTKLGPRDVPAVVRLVEQADLATALAYARGQPKLEPSAEFILTCLPQRMAQTLREEATFRGKVKSKEGEQALGKIVAVIRQLETSGEITLQQPDD